MYPSTQRAASAARKMRGSSKSGHAKHTAIEPTWTWTQVQGVGTRSWFETLEIVTILSNWRAMGATIAEKSSPFPPSGSLFLYDVAKLRKFREDKVDWMRKPNGRIKETTTYLRSNGHILASCNYARSASRPGFCRRIYALRTDPPKPEVGTKPPAPPLQNSFVLVHYLDTTAASNFAAADLTATQSFAGAAALRAPARGAAHGMGVNPIAPPSMCAFDSTDALTLDALGPGSMSPEHSALEAQRWEREREQDAQFFVSQAARSSQSPCFQLSSSSTDIIQSVVDLGLGPGGSGGGGGGGVGREGRREGAIGQFAQQQQHQQQRFVELSATFFLAPIAIVDCAPSRGSFAGGEKILLVVDVPRGGTRVRADGRICTWLVRFGVHILVAKCIAPGVLRCFAPPAIVAAPNALAHSVVGSSGLVANIEVRLTIGSPNVVPVWSSNIGGGFDSLETQTWTYVEEPVAAAAVAAAAGHRPERRRVVAASTAAAAAFSPAATFAARSSSSSATPGSLKRSHSEALLSSPILGSTLNTNANYLADDDVSVEYDSDQGEESALEALNDDEIDTLSSKLNEKFLTNLVQYAVRENMMGEMNALDSCGFNLLHYVCLYNHQRLAQVLIQQGSADINALSADGRTPLTIAVMRGHDQLARDLERCGAAGNGATPGHSLRLAAAMDVGGSSANSGGGGSSSSSRMGVVGLGLGLGLNRSVGSTSSLGGGRSGFSRGEGEEDAAPSSVTSTSAAEDFESSVDRRLLLHAFDGMSLADRCAMWQGLSGAAGSSNPDLAAMRDAIGVDQEGGTGTGSGSSSPSGSGGGSFIRIFSGGDGGGSGGRGGSSGRGSASSSSRLGSPPGSPSSTHSANSGVPSPHHRAKAAGDLFAAAGADLDDDEVSARLSNSFAVMSMMSEEERFGVETQV